MRRLFLTLVILGCASYTAAVAQDKPKDEARERGHKLLSGHEEISKAFLGETTITVRYNSAPIGTVKVTIKKSKDRGKDVYAMTSVVDISIAGSTVVKGMMGAKLGPDFTLRWAKGTEHREVAGKTTDQTYEVRARGKDFETFIWTSTTKGMKPEVREIKGHGRLMLGSLCLTFPAVLMEMKPGEAHAFAALDIKQGVVNRTAYVRSKPTDVEIRGEKQRAVPVTLVTYKGEQKEKAEAHLQLESGQLSLMVDQYKVEYHGEDPAAAPVGKPGTEPADRVALMFAAAASKDKATLAALFDVRRYQRDAAVAKAEGPEERAMAADTFDKDWRANGRKRADEFIDAIVKNPYWKDKPKTAKSYRAYCTQKKDGKTAAVTYSDGVLKLTYRLELMGKRWRIVSRDR